MIFCVLGKIDMDKNKGSIKKAGCAVRGRVVVRARVGHCLQIVTKMMNS